MRTPEVLDRDVIYDGKLITVRLQARSSMSPAVFGA
jgi:hypothetical protein